MSDYLSAQLLREIENENSPENENDDELNDGVIDEAIIEVNYELVSGFRMNSQLMWAYDEMQLYYKYSSSKNKTAYTCRIEGCTARVFLREDKTAFKDTRCKHSNAHGTQYKEYKAMYCDNKMKQKAKSAPASMTPYDIYMEVVAE